MKQEPSCGLPWSQENGRAVRSDAHGPHEPCCPQEEDGASRDCGQGKGPRSWAATDQHGRVVSCPLAPHVAMLSSVPVYRGCA